MVLGTSNQGAFGRDDPNFEHLLISARLCLTTSIKREASLMIFFGISYAVHYVYYHRSVPMTPVLGSC